MYPPFVVKAKGKAKRDGNVTLAPGKGVPRRGRASVRATDAAPPRITYYLILTTTKNYS